MNAAEMCVKITRKCLKHEKCCHMVHWFTIIIYNSIINVSFTVSLKINSELSHWCWAFLLSEKSLWMWFGCFTAQRAKVPCTWLQFAVEILHFFPDSKGKLNLSALQFVPSMIHCPWPLVCFVIWIFEFGRVGTVSWSVLLSITLTRTPISVPVSGTTTEESPTSM